MRVWIKGAGDLATGIACRLHRSGFQVMMTEIEVPTTVRRTVAFSPAVYEGEAVVEGIRAVRCETLEAADEAVNKGLVAVLVDETGETARGWNADAVVDAIIAKRNTGTSLTDAPVVIGVGPGFTAGVDCHCVVETKRGHNLGRCLYEGFAAPNTGVPGIIGGYGKERVVRAPEAGIFRGVREIGDRVEAGEEDVCCFAVCDQPWLKAETVRGLVEGFLRSGKGLGCLGCRERAGDKIRLGNPAIFAPRYRRELLALTGDVGGRKIIKKHPEDLYVFQVSDVAELEDVDTRSQLPAASTYSSAPSE